MESLNDRKLKYTDLKMINQSFLNKIANAKYLGPVVSVYLNSGMPKNDRDPKMNVAQFNSLKNEAVKRQQNYLPSLSHDQKKSLEQDLENVKELVTNEPATTRFPSLVVFKSANELATLIKLPFPLLPDRLVIDNSPYTAPLTAMLQLQKKVLVAKLDIDRTVFFLYNLGNCEKITHIPTQSQNEEVDKSRPNKVQLHHLVQLKRHLKIIDDYIYRQFTNQAFDFLIVIGHEKTTTKQLIRQLHPKVRERLLQEVAVSPLQWTDANSCRLLVEKTLVDFENKYEQEAISEVVRARGQHGLVEGLEQVINAQNRGLLTTLYVDKNLQQEGYICPERHYLSLSPEECKICERAMQKSDDIVDELIELAVAKNVDTVIFSQRPELMKEYQQIAALIYLTT